MAQLRLVQIIDIASARRADEFWTPRLEPMQIAIIEVPAHGGKRRRLVVAKANALGGVCDDCTDFDSYQIATCAIYEVVL